MPHYNLLRVSDQRVLSTTAKDCRAALLDFSEKLETKLILDENRAEPAPYLLDEWYESPHWVDPTTPVFEVVE